MVGDGLLRTVVGRDEAAFVDELLEELRVVDDLELCTHVRVLVEEGVEAVRAVCDDRLLLVVDSGLIEEFYQSFGEDLVEIFVT